MRSPSILTSLSAGPIRARRTTSTTVCQVTLASVSDSLSVAEAASLLDGLRSGRDADELGAPVGRPVLVVDLDRAAPRADLRPPPGWPGVLIATSGSTSPPEPPGGPDVLISAAADPPRPWVGAGELEGATGSVEAAVRRNPQAATTLAQVLRVAAPLGPAAALVVESLAYSTLQAGPEHRVWLEGQPARRPDERTDPAVQVQREAGTLWIILDRPERRNAYSARMRDDLVAALEVAAADPTISSVHLSGHGANFCSGGDLAEFGTRPDPATAHGIRTLRSAGWWVSQLASRVTVHLHGACVGAGIELAAFAEAVKADGATTVMLPEVSMGLIPGAGGTASIAHRIGRERTAWLALTGLRLDATTALRWGLIDRISPSE